MQALQGLHPLKPGLQGVYSLIGPRLAVKLDTRVPPSSHQRVYSQMFENWSIYLGVPKLGKMIRIKKARGQKDPGAWERGT